MELHRARLKTVKRSQHRSKDRTEDRSREVFFFFEREKRSGRKWGSESEVGREDGGGGGYVG